MNTDCGYTGLSPVMTACELSRKTAIAMGLNWYFTGRACNRGHIALRMVVSRCCLECLRAGRKAYKINHKDAILFAQRERRKVRFATDPVYVEKVRLKDRIRHIKRSDKRKASTKRWAEKNPEKRADILARYRQKKRASTVSPLPRGTVKRLEVLQKNTCAACYSKLVLSGPGKYHIDHIVPISKGGCHIPENLQLLCPGCNHKKTDMDSVAFMQRMGRLL